MIPYNHALDPPAPFLEITIANRNNRRWRAAIPALLDTGIDVLTINYPIVKYSPMGEGQGSNQRQVKT